MSPLSSAAAASCRRKLGADLTARSLAVASSVDAGCSPCLWRRMRPLKTGVMLSVRTCMHAIWEAEGTSLKKKIQRRPAPHPLPHFSSSLISIMQFWINPFQERKGGGEGMAFSPPSMPCCPCRAVVAEGGEEEEERPAPPARPPASRAEVSRVTIPYPAYKDHHATAAWNRRLYRVSRRKQNSGRSVLPNACNLCSVSCVI